MYAAGNPEDILKSHGTVEYFGSDEKHSKRPSDARPKSAKPQPWPNWRDDLLREGTRIVPNLANVAHALRNAPALAGLIAMDEMACAPVLRGAVPGARGGVLGFPRKLTDVDVHGIQEWLQRAGLPRIGHDVVHQGADLVAVENGFHPVRDYLVGVSWDGTRRLSTWLTDYLGVDATTYTANVGQWFLISMVARVMQPGAKVDHLLVLEGTQGTLKSTACGVLGDAWFSDSLPPLQRADEVRLSMHLRGKWLIEIPELASFSKADVELLKSFITRREEVYVPKYGRREVREPRQCCFVATTNEATYLKDETGGRRFWPVKCGNIDVNALRLNRDQLWAEAFKAFQEGASWWPDRTFEAEHIKPQQSARFVEDAWAGPINDYLEVKVKEGKSRKVTILEIATYALTMGTERLGTADQRRIARVLTSLGWEGKKQKTGVVWEPKG